MRVQAGSRIIDVAATTADARYVSPQAERKALGGGNLTLAAGGDIQSAYVYVAKGLDTLRAAGQIGASGNRRTFTQSLGSLLMAGDASYRISATGGVLLEGELQPFALIPTRSADDYATDPFIFFNRYGTESSLSVRSAGGGVLMRNTLETFVDDQTIAFSEKPNTTQASVHLAAFGGDLTATLTSIGSPSGQLSLYARRDIEQGIYLMSDVPLEPVFRREDLQQHDVLRRLFGCHW